jgi:hypothetical protein
VISDHDEIEPETKQQEQQQDNIYDEESKHSLEFDFPLPGPKYSQVLNVYNESLLSYQE